MPDLVTHESWILIFVSICVQVRSVADEFIVGVVLGSQRPLTAMSEISRPVRAKPDYIGARFLGGPNVCDSG